MATTILRRQIMYKNNFRALIQQFRAFSCDGYKVVGRGGQDVMRNWPDTKLGNFSPPDKNYPLPGFTRLSETPSAPVIEVEVEVEVVKKNEATRRFMENLPEERYQETIRQVEETLEDDYGTIVEDTLYLEGPGADDLLECVAHDCPDRMKKDFVNLFPTVDIKKGPFTVITISQKTHLDMTGWSSAVEEEREILLKTFIEGATEICDALQTEGFWADFVDPSSGKPYRGDNTNECMFETDERYKKLGFQIDDLGCCKVIVHKLWGTHSFIGSIFTNAPLSHHILKQMRKRRP